ncbi:hypothetical protein SUGI_0759850 [Cryptomeria japonica]|nr:hypothetical protein SUGI_0759850 [Cryptomeria japonica]
MQTQISLSCCVAFGREGCVPTTGFISARLIRPLQPDKNLNLLSYYYVQQQEKSKHSSRDIHEPIDNVHRGFY